MRTIYTNIAQLCGITHGELRKAGQEMARVETMTDAWLAVEDDKSWISAREACLRS